MIRPDDVPQVEQIVEAWMRFIEQELLRAWPVSMGREEMGTWPVDRHVGRLYVAGFLPSTLLRTLDDELKRYGWRLYRPIDEFSGTKLSPQRATKDNAVSFFEVEPDRLCKHYFRRLYLATHAFCRDCGEKPGPNDHVWDR